MITCLIGVAVPLSCAYAPGGPLSALAARTVALETRTRRRKVVVFMNWHSVGLGSDSASGGSLPPLCDAKWTLLWQPHEHPVTAQLAPRSVPMRRCAGCPDRGDSSR